MFFKKEHVDIDLNNLPKHIGFIMDGNGRWAKKRGLPRSAGHKAGAESLKKIITEANNLGVKYATVYAFSTENWKRPKEEVDYLMSLLMDYLVNAEKTLAGENVVIRAIGSRKELVKTVKKYTEEAKVQIRNARRDALDDYKKKKKDGEVTEDDLNEIEKDIQKLTDKYIKEIDTICADKEKEILEV